MRSKRRKRRRRRRRRKRRSNVGRVRVRNNPPASGTTCTSFSAIFPNDHIMRAICFGWEKNALCCIHAAVKLLIKSGETRNLSSVPASVAHAHIILETCCRDYHHTTAYIIKYSHVVRPPHVAYHTRELSQIPYNDTNDDIMQWVRSLAIGTGDVERVVAASDGRQKRVVHSFERGGRNMHAFVRRE